MDMEFDDDVVNKEGIKALITNEGFGKVDNSHAMLENGVEHQNKDDNEMGIDDNLSLSTIDRDDLSCTDDHFFPVDIFAEGITVKQIITEPPTDAKEAKVKQHPRGPRKKVQLLGACEKHKHLHKKKIVGMNCNECHRQCKLCTIFDCSCDNEGILWFTTQWNTSEKVYLHQDVGDDEVRVVHLKWKYCHELVQKRRDILRRRQAKMA